jgi:MFS family permease
MSTPRIADGDPNEDAGFGRRGVLALVLLACGQLILSVDYSVVYVALPSIERALHFSEQSVQWVVSAYALTFGGFLLLGGRAADLLKARPVIAR